jgi:hypothetical protein
LRDFFLTFAVASIRVLVQGGHVFFAMNLVLPHLGYLAILDPEFEKTGEVIRPIKHPVAMRRRSCEQDVKAFQSNFAHNCQLRMAPYDDAQVPPMILLCNAKPALCFSATSRAFAGDHESGPAAKVTPLDQSATIGAQLPKVRVG